MKQLNVITLLVLFISMNVISADKKKTTRTHNDREVVRYTDKKTGTHHAIRNEGEEDVHWTLNSEDGMWEKDATTTKKIKKRKKNRKKKHKNSRKGSSCSESKSSSESSYIS